MKKFDEAFRNATKEKYPFVRFVRAEYSAGNKNLLLYFIATAFAIDNKLLTDEVKSEIAQELVPLISEKDITFTVKYVKVSADEDTVKSKLLQSVVKYIPVVPASFAEDDIFVAVNDYLINVKMVLPKSLYTLLAPQHIRDKIVDDLNESFVERIDFEVAEKYVSDEEKQKILENSRQTIDDAGVTCNISVDARGNVKEGAKGDDDAFSGLMDLDDAIVMYQQSRQIKAAQINIVVGRAYMNVMPMYICDIRDSFESATVCGTVMGFSRREYKNKNYGLPPDNGKGRFKKNVEDETLPMYNFTIDDTTGKISVVYFGRSMKDDAFKTFVGEGTNIVVSGKISERNGALQIVTDSLWTADIDFSTVKTDMPSKKEAKKYKNIVPEKYVEEKQVAVTDIIDGEKEPCDYLRGKTFVVFDLETTGLDIAKCKIVQLGAYKIIDGKIVESFRTLVNPGCHIPEASTAIHGIADGDVASAPYIEEVIPDFYKFTRGATLVGHNLFGYDLPILNRDAKENGYIFDNPALDTLIIAKSQYSLSAYNLVYLAKHFNLNLTNAHNADFDAIATAKLFILLAERL